MGRTAQSLRLHGAQERKFIGAGEVGRLRHFRFGDFVRVYAGDADSLAVHLQHNPHGVGFVVLKDVLQNKDDEGHGGVVVIMEQNAIQRRLFDRCATFNDDAFFMNRTLIRHMRPHLPNRRVTVRG